MPYDPSSRPKDKNTSTEGSEKQENLNGSPSPEKSKNPVIKILKKVGYSVWMIVLVVGGTLAIIASLVAL